MTDFILSVDLGQSVDYSAMSVLRRVWRQNGIDPSQWPLFHEIPFLKRWPLGTPYPIIIEDVLETYSFLTTISQLGVKVIVDQGGPGRPVIDLLRNRGIRPIGITITPGQTVNERDDSSLMVPKRDICSALVVSAQCGDVKIAADLELADELGREIEAFGYTINRRTGTMSYESVVDKVHDDLVVSVAMGLWYSTTRISKRYPIEHGRPEPTSSDLSYNPIARQP